MKPKFENETYQFQNGWLTAIFHSKFQNVLFNHVNGFIHCKWNGSNAFWSKICKENFKVISQNSRSQSSFSDFDSYFAIQIVQIYPKIFSLGFINVWRGYGKSYVKFSMATLFLTLAFIFKVICVSFFTGSVSSFICGYMI